MSQSNITSAMQTRTPTIDTGLLAGLRSRMGLHTSAGSHILSILRMQIHA